MDLDIKASLERYRGLTHKKYNKTLFDIKCFFLFLFSRLLFSRFLIGKPFQPKSRAGSGSILKRIQIPKPFPTSGWIQIPVWIRIRNPVVAKHRCLLDLFLTPHIWSSPHVSVPFFVYVRLCVCTPLWVCTFFARFCARAKGALRGFCARICAKRSFLIHFCRCQTRRTKVGFANDISLWKPQKKLFF